MEQKKWRARARAAIRAYPALCKKEKELHSMAITPAYSGQPGGGEAQRTTENVATRCLPPDEDRQLRAVERALMTTLTRRSNGKLRTEMIRRMYWSHERLETAGAADAVHVSIATAQHWHKDFVELVDAYIG